MAECKEYLGDGLFVEFDGWQFRLYTTRENGVHQVYLEPAVLRAFMGFVDEMAKEMNEKQS